MTPRTLMLVSTRVTDGLRAAVADGREPTPEFLDLERRFGVDLLDWSQLGAGSDHRGPLLSLRHVAAALRRVRQYDAVISDGEHVGIPLALALMSRRLRVPHIVIGHHVSTRAKAPFFSLLRADRGITGLLLHSEQQVASCLALGFPAAKLHLVPYFADTTFWCDSSTAQEPLVVAAGREHRDYATLARAMAGMSEHAIVAAGSPNSPAATCAMPVRTPPNVTYVAADRAGLRALYARAQVVAVPLLETDFQAGVTSLLEAMSMGRATVVTATSGGAAVVRDGVNGLHVAPGDAGELRRAIRFLLDHPAERARIGRAARRDVERNLDLHHYSGRIWDQLVNIAGAAAA